LDFLIIALKKTVFWGVVRHTPTAEESREFDVHAREAATQI
jgi:hypothetical protein